MRNEIRRRVDDVVGLLPSREQIGARSFRRAGFFRNPLDLSIQHEPHLRRPMSVALAMKDGAFMDVGANRGQTLGKVLALDPERRYLGFEPQLDGSNAIQQFIRDNKLVHCTIFPFGLSDRPRTLRLYRRKPGADRSASMVEGFRPESFYQDSAFIHVVTGDSVLEELDEDVGVLKVDVEGAELEVFQGLVGMLERCRPIIFFEVLANYLKITRSNLDSETVQFRQARRSEMAKLFATHRYILHRLDEPAVVLPELAAPDTPDHSSRDVIAVPAEDEAAWQAAWK